MFFLFIPNAQHFRRVQIFAGDLDEAAGIVRRQFGERLPGTIIPLRLDGSPAPGPGLFVKRPKKAACSALDPRI